MTINHSESLQELCSEDITSSLVHSGNETKKRKKRSFDFLPLFWRRNETKSNKKRNESHENDFSGKLTILNDSQVQNIDRALPPAQKSSTWTLSFSTKLDDFSLQTLYKNLSETDTPGILLIIEDTDRQIFGAYSSSKLEDSENCQDGCFLFTFQPDFRKFNVITGEDDNTVSKSTPDNLVFGQKEGSNAGLWIDSDLCNGRSEECKMFNSPPLVPQKRFTIRCLECWSIE